MRADRVDEGLDSQAERRNGVGLRGINGATGACRCSVAHAKAADPGRRTGAREKSRSLAGCIVTTQADLLWGVALALLLGLVVGLVNGAGVAFANIHPLVMTLSTMTFLQGLAYLILAVPGGQVAAPLGMLANGSVFGIPQPLLWCAVFAGLAAQDGGRPVSAGTESIAAPRRAMPRWREVFAWIVTVPPAYPGTVILLVLAAFLRSCSRWGCCR
ncbi:hypothetical protein BH11PSE8_BH11PSE8_22050 [soil metagenome]